jgi:stearoyl-CoA desaturase (delta-9 desaturase)
MEMNASRLRRSLALWFDNDALAVGDAASSGRIDWLRVIPFVGLHLGCLAVFWVGTSTVAVSIAVGLYALRMFAITGFYHRYFAHRAFSTFRLAQFSFALLGAMGAQRGPLWWASHHRHHHANSDQPDDAHSAMQHGFLWSHMGWFLARENFATRSALVGDLARFPELRFLNRYDALIPFALGALLFALGEALAARVPGLGTNGWQLVVWGACVSTIALYHATFTINSLAHRFGRRRYATSDDSRNNFWLALLTFGEGWHNNHHHFPGAARQGFYWWEIDITYYGLRTLEAFGIIWDLRRVTEPVRASRRIGRPT